MPAARHDKLQLFPRNSCLEPGPVLYSEYLGLLLVVASLLWDVRLFRHLRRYLEVRARMLVCANLS
jgi:hypothetical protein